MKRAELYRVKKANAQDAKRQRVFVVVSRQALIDSKFSTVVCAPVYSRHDGLSTQVRIGLEEGLKKESSIHCDELVSIPKTMLTNYVGSLNATRAAALDFALLRSLDLQVSALQ